MKNFPYSRGYIFRKKNLHAEAYGETRADCILHSSIKTEKRVICACLCVHLQVSHCTETAWIFGCLKVTVNILMCFVGCPCRVVFT